MFHVKQKIKSSSFFGRELGSLLSEGSPFFLKNFDFRLLPCLLPLIGQKVLVFYDSVPEEIYRGLLLFFKKVLCMCGRRSLFLCVISFSE